LTIEFETYLLGFYNNKRQAQSFPTEFSQVFLLWEKIEGGYHSKQWKRSEGPDKPYREKYHKMVEHPPDRIVVENYNLDWTRNPKCDMIFTWDGQAWNGRVIGDECIIAGGIVTSEVRITRDVYESKDKAVTPGGLKVFGGDEMYRLNKTKSHI
jgi:hypothetical protein